MAANSNVDSRGIVRGSCFSCSCDGYNGGSEQKKCIGCGHPPGKHQNLNTTSSVSSSSGVSSISALSPPSATFSDGGLSYSSDSDSAVFMTPVYQCQYPGCQRETVFDPNTGAQKSYCQDHILYTQMLQQSSPASHAAFTTPRWSLGNTDSSDFASSQSDSSDSDQDQSLRRRVQSDAGRPKSAAAPNSSSTSAKGGLLASMIANIFQLGPQNPQPLSPQKRTQSAAGPALARPMTRPMTAPSPQVQQLTAVPQAQPLQVQQPIPGQQVCKLRGCNRTRYVDSGGKMHDCCGITHARLYEQQCAPQIPQHLQCATPGCMKQKHPNEKGGYFDYCSRYCRDHGVTSAYGKCSLPECQRPKYRDPANGRIHDYCGRSHAAEARARGLQPSNPSMVRQANQHEFSKVSQQFTRDWDRRKGTCPQVDYVFVVSNSALESRWSAYRQNLQDQTVEEYYHGTKLICNLSNMPCTKTDCGVCGISNMGLDRRCIRKNINFQRFGHGFYLAPNSSKCHDYTQGANGYRAMLLCAVCPGRKYVLQTDHVTLKGPPQGYDCVFGKEGSSLNYAEIVVYNPDAVVPRYIIVYQKDGVHKIAK